MTTDQNCRLCPVHRIPDCSPLLNGCSRLTEPRENRPDRIPDAQRPTSVLEAGGDAPTEAGNDA